MFARCKDPEFKALKKRTDEAEQAIMTKNGPGAQFVASASSLLAFLIVPLLAACASPKFLFRAIVAARNFHTQEGSVEISGYTFPKGIKNLARNKKKRANTNEQPALLVFFFEFWKGGTRSRTVFVRGFRTQASNSFRRQEASGPHECLQAAQGAGCSLVLARFLYFGLNF